MSKTFEDQALKAKALAKGMKVNLNELAARGVKEDVLDSLIAASEEAIKMSQEVDRLRMAATEKLQEANAALSEVKEKYNELRMIIKSNYPLEQWYNSDLWTSVEIVLSYQHKSLVRFGEGFFCNSHLLFSVVKLCFVCGVAGVISYFLV